MAASASDKARKSYSYLQKTLSSGISDVATVLTPNNVTNIPTDTGVSFVVDRVDSSGVATPTLRELMTGVVSGSTITGLVRGEQGTTAQAHLSGAVIEFVNSGEMWNDLIDFVMQDHSNPSGYHKNLTDVNGNEWVKQVATASAVNELTVANAATGTAPELSATGDDTNVNLRLKGKGTGRVYADLHPPLLYAQEGFLDFVASGGVWSGDAYASTLAASMTAIVVYVNGRRIAIGAVTARAFTASKDTYIDILDNADGTGTLVYTEVANNAASPALAANSIRIGIIVSGATNIAAAGSVNQGQVEKVLPIASSIPYAVTDSLGNMICSRDPNRKILGYRQILSTFSTASATAVQVTGVSVPVIIPTGRKVKLTAFAPGASNGTAGLYAISSIWRGVVASGTQIAGSTNLNPSATREINMAMNALDSTGSGSVTYNLGLNQSGGGTASLIAGATTPIILIVELA